MMKLLLKVWPEIIVILLVLCSAVLSVINKEASVVMYCMTTLNCILWVAIAIKHKLSDEK